MKKDEIYYTPEGSPVAPFKFDVRVQLRNRSKGLISDADLKKYLASLPDEKNSGVFVDYDAVINDEKEAGAAAPSTGGGGSTTH